MVTTLLSYLPLLFMLSAAEMPDKKVPLAPELAGAVDRTVSDEEPDWVLERSSVVKTSMIKVWMPRPSLGSSGQEASTNEDEAQRVRVQVFALASEEDARAEVKRYRRSVSIGEGEPIDHLGDEAYVLEGLQRPRHSHDLRQKSQPPDHGHWTFVDRDGALLGSLVKRRRGTDQKSRQDAIRKMV